MNLPCCVAFKVSSPVCVIGRSVADVEECLADNRNDRRLSDLQFPARSEAKGKLDLRPTKHKFAKLTPLRFCGYLNYNNAGFIASRISKCLRSAHKDPHKRGLSIFSKRSLDIFACTKVKKCSPIFRPIRHPIAKHDKKK